MHGMVSVTWLSNTFANRPSSNARQTWLRPSAWIDQNGEARVSLDLDASRITLLDRIEANDPQQEEITILARAYNHHLRTEAA